jgi:hypothetical protein
MKPLHYSNVSCLHKDFIVIVDFLDETRLGGQGFCIYSITKLFLVVQSLPKYQSLDSVKIIIHEVLLDVNKALVPGSL